MSTVREMAQAILKEQREVFSEEILARGFKAGVEAAVSIIEERGRRIGGAVQPDRTVAEIRERLLNV